MSRKDISVYVLDRNLNRTVLEPEDGDLKPFIKLLSEREYNVVAEESLRRDLREFDLLVLHPPHYSINMLYRFHRESPQIPLLFCSGAIIRGKRVDSSLMKDDDGNYIATTHRPEELLRIVEYLLYEKTKVSQKSL